MPCSCVVCLPCCVLLLDSSRFVAIVRIHLSTLGFVVASSSSWTRSSFLWDFRQDDRYPGSHYYHCYASCFVLSLCCATYHLFIKPPQFAMSASNLFTLPSKPLLGYVTALLSPLTSLLVAGEVEDCSMVDRIMLGYHNISCNINASIYLVKGGRLGLMPGVLFHSCRPSFRHTGVMFPDFAFLTRLGDLWDPLDSSL